MKNDCADVTADRLTPDMCGWQTSYGTGTDKPHYCSAPAGADGLCGDHRALAHDLQH